MISAALYIFISWVVASIVYTPTAALLIHRACAEQGIGADDCRPGVDGYKEADANFASEKAFLDVISGVSQLLTCKLLGDMGDSFGRRGVLLSPCINAIVGNLAMALLPAKGFNVVFGPLSFVASLFGGSYVANHLAFATVADATRSSSSATRSLCFSVVEAFLWAGLLSGPVVSGFLVDWMGPQNVFLVAAGGAVLNLAITYFTYPETLEPERRRPFHLARGNPCTTLPIFLHSRTTLLLGLSMLFGQFATNGGLAVVTLDAENFTSSSTILGYLLSMNMGMQCFGLCVLMPALLKFFSLRHILLLSLFMAFVSWNCCATATGWQQLMWFSLLSPANAAFFPVVRTGISNSFGAKSYGESLAAVGVVEQIASTVGATAMSKVFSWTNTLKFVLTNGFGIRCIAFSVAGGCSLVGFLLALGTGHIPSERPSEESETNGCATSTSDTVEPLVHTVAAA